MKVLDRSSRNRLGRRESQMAYGPLTKGHISSISRGELYSEAGQWRPDRYTLPFPDRLAEFVETYFEALPADTAGRKATLTVRIQQGAAEHGVRLARNTLNEWLTGGRDPSVSSSDAQTRENIYKLCAALDLDQELAEELFEKVFFSRAFDLKVLKELAFFFFARRDYQEGVEGCRWYQTGEATWNAVRSSVEPDADGEEETVRNTVLLADQTAVMNEVEFLHYLSQHQNSFQRENRYIRARESIREYARTACRLAKILPQRQDGDDIPYEPLINHILGYSQRSVSGAGGTVSSLKSLPPQLTTNFPTGQILRKICIGDACSYDQVYKMFCLLLFYCYHANLSGGINREQRLNGFLRFANLSLEQQGCTELYPRQPYGGLLLFCAAQENPISALRDFVESAVAEESENVLMQRMQDVPGISDEQRRALIRCAEWEPFLVSLIAGTMSRRGCTLRPEALTQSGYYDDRPVEIIQKLYLGAGFSAEEKQVLECCALLPTDGVSETLFRQLFPDRSFSTALKLADCGWLSKDKGSWSMHHRIRKAVLGQEVEGKHIRAFLNDAARLDPSTLAEREAIQWKKLLRHK